MSGVEGGPSGVPPAGIPPAGDAPAADALAADAPATDAPPASSETGSESPSEDASATGALETRPTRRRRLRRFFRLPRSRRALGALGLVFGGFAIVIAIGGYQVIHWTETADFCGRCHTMGPELAAHAGGPHSEVTCGECHVEPGVSGWIKAKINGTRQLIEIVAGTFPEPIPPPEHDALPDPKDTCQRCHDITRIDPSNLVTRLQFTQDEANTRQFVGLMVRPGNSDILDASRGVHWHVLRKVSFWTPDPFAQQIDLVDVPELDGTVSEYIAQGRVRVGDDVGPDVAKIKAEDKQVQMSCYECHNRVGHPIPNPRRGLDAALTTGQIDAGLPYIKREGMRILWGNYPTDAAADAEADKLASFYALHYPDAYKSKTSEIYAAIEQIKFLYRLTATPEMKVTALTYPDSLGHTDYPGCFRCHDGGHYLIQDGVLTSKTIPSSCDTCHTFPQIGGAVATMPIGIPPVSHSDSEYVFTHRNIATSVDPGGTSCGECHARDYCDNCHKTGAVTVQHDQMLTNHAQAIKESPTGAEACSYCHQPAYCARCHNEPVLPGSAPGSAAIPKGPPGLEWPLLATLPVATTP